MKNQEEEIADMEKQLSEQLQKYKVEVPELPVKVSRITRVANWIYTQTEPPFSKKVHTKRVSIGVMVLPFFILLVSLLPIMLTL